MHRHSERSEESPKVHVTLRHSERSEESPNVHVTLRHSERSEESHISQMRTRERLFIGARYFLGLLFVQEILFRLPVK